MELEKSVSEDEEQQREELEALASIYSQEITILNEGKEFLVEISPIIDGDLQLVHKSREDLQPTSEKAPHYSISHLPSATLYVRYHHDYPSQTCPVFHLSARWLADKHLPQLNEKLKSMFIKGLPVVYEWISFLSSQVVSFLSEDGLECDPEKKLSETTPQLFVRSLSQCNDIVAHDQFKQHQLFVESKHDCGICFMQKFGEEFTSRCHGCKGSGLFCKQCVRQYCETLIGEGNIASITCPDTNCTAKLTDTLLQSLLPSSTYTRYKHLFNELSLDSIPGMVYCPLPTCGARTISEQDSNLAVCQECKFPFCKLCQQTWHGVEPCLLLEKVKKAEENEEDKKEGAINTKSSQEEQRRIEEMKSAVWIRSHDSVKCCPKCQQTIQKHGGCNKMSCLKCGTSFCWLCGNIIQGYNHFYDDVCPLFRDEDYLPPEEEEQPGIPDQQEDLQHLLFTECPRCGQQKTKVNNMNWMTCDKCRFQFCHLCKEACFGRYHFSEYGCKEMTTLKEDMELLSIDKQDRNALPQDKEEVLHT